MTSRDVDDDTRGAYGALVKALLNNVDERCGLCGGAAPLVYRTFGYFEKAPASASFAVCTPCARIVEREAMHARVVRRLDR